MKIIHIVDYFNPFMGYQENHLALIQNELGHEVVIISSNLFTPWYSESSETIQRGDKSLLDKGIKVIRLEAITEYSHRVWLKGLDQVLLDEKPDIVHSHGFATINSFLCAWHKAEYKYSLLIDDHMLFNAIKNPLAFMFYPFFKFSFAYYIRKKADSLVSVSNETTQFMRKKYGISQHRIKEIPLGVNLKYFYPYELKRRQLLKETRLQSDDPVVIYTGKMDHYKNPLKGLEAAKILWDKGVKFRFLLVGFGSRSYLQKIENFIIKNGFEDNVTFKPTVPNEELPDFFNMTDVALWPCQSSMSAIEAMACGCPIVLSSTQVNRERTGTGSGLVYESDNIDDLAEKMGVLLSDAQKRKNMGEKGIEYSKTCDWNKITKTVLNIYNQIKRKNTQ